MAKAVHQFDAETVATMQPNLQDRDIGRALPTEPTFFLDSVIGRWFVVWMCIPLFFIFVKLVRAEFINIELSDVIVSYLNFAWPLLGPQYEAIKSRRLPGDAANFALFHLSMFLYLAFLIALTIRGYVKLRSSVWIAYPGRREAVIIGLCAAVGLGGLILDAPTKNPRPIWDFYIDSAGLYYLRQSCFIVCAGNAVLMALISTTRMIDVFPGARSRN